MSTCDFLCTKTEVSGRLRKRTRQALDVHGKAANCNWDSMARVQRYHLTAGTWEPWQWPNLFPLWKMFCSKKMALTNCTLNFQNCARSLGCKIIIAIAAIDKIGKPQESLMVDLDSAITTKVKPFGSKLSCGRPASLYLTTSHKAICWVAKQHLDAPVVPAFAMLLMYLLGWVFNGFEM